MTQENSMIFKFPCLQIKFYWKTSRAAFAPSSRVEYVDSSSCDVDSMVAQKAKNIYSLALWRESLLSSVLEGP